MPEPDPPAQPALSRRRALRVGSGGAVALVLGVGIGWRDRQTRGPEANPVREFLASDFDVTEPHTATSTTTAAPVVLPEIGEVDTGIIALGHRALLQHDLGSLDSLLRSIPDPDGDPVAQAAAVTAAEFRNGATLVVDGWVLAASEVRAAAALALMCDEVSC